MSKISKEHYDQLAAFVASVKDSVCTDTNVEIYGLYIQPFEAFERQVLTPFLGWDSDGKHYTWLRDGIETHNMVDSTNLMVETAVTKFAPLPEVTPEIIHNLYNEDKLYYFNKQKINHLILTLDEKCFAGSFKKMDGTYGTFSGSFNQTNHFGFYSKTETTARVPFAEAFKQFQAALNGFTNPYFV